MARWYYLQKGRPVGPVTIDDLKIEIAAGRLGRSDLLYLERDITWKPASSFAELEALFVISGPTSISSVSPGGGGGGDTQAEWVWLHRKADGSGYQQRGPFTRAQILTFLRKGEATWTDHLWRKGLKEWYKILALPEFHPNYRPPKEKAPPPPLAATAPNSTSIQTPTPEKEPVLTKDLSEITQRLPMPEETGEVPVDTQPIRKALLFKDPVEAPANDSPKAVVRRSKKRQRPPRVRVLEIARRISLVNYYLGLRGVKKTLFLSAVGAVFILGIFLVTYISSYRDRQNIVLKPTPPTYIQPKPIETKPTTAITVPPPAPQAKKAQAKVAMPRVEPTYLKSMTLQNGSEGPRIRVLTDGSFHFPITVVFTSGAGRVLKKGSVARVVRLSRTDERDIDVGRLRLPPGFYDIALTMGHVRGAGKVAIGTQAPDFNKRLNVQRKQLIYGYNEERYNFLKTAGRLEIEAGKFALYAENASSLKSWSGFYKDWQTALARIQSPYLKKISGKNRGEFVHAEKWLELKLLQSQVLNESKKFNRMKIKDAAQKSGDMRALVVGLHQLRERMLEESMWEPR